ncbi:sulfite exporter TauE/SafE family protein [Sphingobacterium sp. CZ-2]|uniref:sulfite exporter TauE/SafE family protein n=1 Tax=Sphingobacterium sp. CZ-2 TaxID=2557994 RepID=UPI001ADA2AD6|nr:sulfite exporter TauE/SafE family protein [Sphingobacterium sp. CZ-2]
MGMLIVGCILAIIVGITLGMIGSGGTILTVPILVYIMGVDPVLATTYSLFAIGITSFIGGTRGIIKKEADIKKVFSFGLPSLIVVFLTRSFILPLVPEVIHIGPYAIQQNVALMIVFSFVMLASSISMIRTAQKGIETPKVAHVVPLEIIILQGAFVGLITGLVGAGGGFLIIPALVNFYFLPMRKAVATSLIIITINSFFGVLGDIEKFAEFDWKLLGFYTAGTVLGIFIGFAFADKVSNKSLKISFGYMILLIGAYILVRETLLA